MNDGVVVVVVVAQVKKKKKELEDIQRRTWFNSTATEICKSAQISKHHREEELEEGVREAKSLGSKQGRDKRFCVLVVC